MRAVKKRNYSNMRKKDTKQRVWLTSLSGHKEEQKSAPVEKRQEWSRRGGTLGKSIFTTVHIELEGDDKGLL